MFCHFYGELWKLQGKEGEVIGKEDYVIKTPMKNVMVSKKLDDANWKRQWCHKWGKISPGEAQGSQWQGREHLCLEGRLTRHLLLNIFLILVFLLNTFNRGNYWLTDNWRNWKAKEEESFKGAPTCKDTWSGWESLKADTGAGESRCVRRQVWWSCARWTRRHRAPRPPLLVISRVFTLTLGCFEAHLPTWLAQTNPYRSNRSTF